MNDKPSMDMSDKPPIEQIIRNDYRRNRFFYIDLLKRFRGFDPEFIELMVPVYYPIGIMNATVVERTLSDFRVVEQTILRLISSGVTDIKVMAEMLGLSSSYVGRIVDVLIGTQQVNYNMTVSDLGKKSLASGKKIEVKEVAQQFQIDAFSGELIKLDETVAKREIFEKKKTGRFLIRFDSRDYVYRKAIEDNILSNYDNLVYLRSELHTNAMVVNSLEFQEMQYAKGYMIKCKDEPAMVFSRRYNRNGERPEDKFALLPFGAPKQARLNHGFDKSVKDYSKEEGEKIQDVVDLLKYETSIQEEDYLTAFQSVTGLNPETINTTYEEDTMHVFLHPDNIMYSSWLVDCLLDMEMYDCSIITAASLKGRIIKVHGEGEDLRVTARLVKYAADHHGLKDVKTRLRNSIEDEVGLPLINKICDVANIIVNSDGEE